MSTSQFPIRGLVHTPTKSDQVWHLVPATLGEDKGLLLKLAHVLVCTQTLRVRELDGGIHCIDVLSDDKSKLPSLESVVRQELQDEKLRAEIDSKCSVSAKQLVDAASLRVSSKQ